MKKYHFTVRNGKEKITLILPHDGDLTSAIGRLCELEHCPESAILKIVVKTKKLTK